MAKPSSTPTAQSLLHDLPPKPAQHTSSKRSRNSFLSTTHAPKVGASLAYGPNSVSAHGEIESSCSEAVSPKRCRIDSIKPPLDEVGIDHDEDVSGGELTDVTLTMADVFTYCERTAESAPVSNAKTQDKRKYNNHDREVCFQRDAQRAAVKAQQPDNTVVCSNFNFARATSAATYQSSRELSCKQAPTTQTFWNDLVPRRMISEDGADLLYHFPQFVKSTGTELLTDQLVSFGQSRNLLIGAGADSKKRNCAAAYRKTPGAVAGCCILARIWHAVGHTHEDGVISTSFLKSGTDYGNSMRLLNDLRFLSVRVNAALKKIDILQYEALSKLVSLAGEKYPHVKALAVIDPLVMEGRAIQFNRQTPRHSDRLDPPKSWAFIVVLGHVTSGTMFFPRLNHRVRYLSGDAVAVRGRLFQHEVEAWEGDQRISIAHFTHTALWNEFGMSCP